MPLSSCRAYYLASTLSNYAYGRESLAVTFAASDIEVYPFQVASADFVMSSPYMKWAILCNDSSLGKTCEVLLTVTPKWYEGQQKTLITVPTSLLGQWLELIDRRFTVPLFTLVSQWIFQELMDEGQPDPLHQDGLGIILLFYHIHLRCYVVVELKVAKFNPASVGQLNFYLSAIDDHLCREGDNLDIGLILCKSKDKLATEYALRGLTQPLAVPDYLLTKAITQELQGALPIIEEIEAGLTSIDGMGSSETE